MSQTAEEFPVSQTSARPTKQLPRFSIRETRKSTIIAFLAWTVAVYDFILFGTLLPRVKEDFGWSSSHALLISTFVSIGTAVVVLGVGPVVDRLGRRKGMMITVGGTALSSAATAASGGAFSLVAAKSIGGMGLSEQAVNATYLNEIYAVSESEAVRKHRGFIYSFVQTGWPLGALLAAGFVALMGSIVGPENWRVVFLVATLPALIIAFICARLKESPSSISRIGSDASARPGRRTRPGLSRPSTGSSTPSRARWHASSRARTAATRSCCPSRG
ncbi:MFS transporter [Prescottella defluvii]|nr:MFS transporter [Prescottella defluvii]